MKPRSAGVVPVRREGGRYLFLLLRVFDYWDFPKGEVEAGETPLDAAIREVEEEAGITDLRFCWGEVFFETGPYRQGKVARYYLAMTDQRHVVLGVNPELGKPEHHEARWVAYSDGLTLLGNRLRRVLEWANQILGQSGE